MYRHNDNLIAGSLAHVSQPKKKLVKKRSSVQGASRPSGIMPSPSLAKQDTVVLDKPKTASTSKAMDEEDKCPPKFVSVQSHKFMSVDLRFMSDEEDGAPQLSFQRVEGPGSKPVRKQASAASGFPGSSKQLSKQPSKASSVASPKAASISKQPSQAASAGKAACVKKVSSSQSTPDTSSLSKKPSVVKKQPSKASSGLSQVCTVTHSILTFMHLFLSL